MFSNNSFSMVVEGDYNICVSMRSNRHSMVQQQWSMTAVTLTLTTVNVATNLFAYIIFARERQQTVLVRLLKALSIFECFFQIVMMVHLLADRAVMLGHVRLHNMLHLRVVCHILCGTVTLLSALHVARNWMVVLISAFRFEAVCRALSGHHFFVVSRIYPMSVLAFLLALLVSAPRYFERSCTYCVHSMEKESFSLSSAVNASSAADVGGSLFLEMMSRRLQVFELYKYIYRVGLLLLLQSGGPIFLVFVFSSQVLLALARQRKVRRRLDQARQRNTTSASRQGSSGDLLVILLSTIFFLCEMPSFFSKLLEENIEIEADILLGNVGNMATLVDTTCNLFVYTVSNAAFRGSVCAILHLCRWKESVPLTSTCVTNGREYASSMPTAGTTINTSKFQGTLVVVKDLEQMELAPLCDVHAQ